MLMGRHQEIKCNLQKVDEPKVEEKKEEDAEKKEEDAEKKEEDAEEKKEEEKE